jgi:SAM-dependent methyltransferase
MAPLFIKGEKMREASKAMSRRSESGEYTEYFKGNGIDIGCGNDNIIQHSNKFPNMLSCIGYDLHQGDAEFCRNIIDQSFDFLHASHCLEHLKNPERGLKNWIRIVKTGGYLIITVPDEQLYEKGHWPSIFNSQHLWSFRFGRYNERVSSIDALTWFDNFLDVKVVSIKRITDNYYDTEDDLTKREDISVECAIEIVLQKVGHTYKPIANWSLNGFCFMLNSLAMGDVIAAAPVVKYMIDTYYTEPDSYLVVAKEMFRSIFWFVPDSNYHNFEDKANDWGIPKGWAIGVLNQKKEQGTGITRNTPKAIHLSQFAAMKICDKLLDFDKLNYVPLPEVDISHFNTDFSNAVIIVSSYRDETRMWKSEYILEVAEWLKERGYLPVFIGKTDMNMDTHLIPKTSLPLDVSEYGLDLRNKTSIPELASIMAKSKAVIGLDSGPIHLAGTTCTPIVCGYTSVDPKYRIPIRSKGNTYTVSSDVPCNYCESNWASSFWNYENCYLGTNECCNKMTANRFIEKLDIFL